MKQNRKAGITLAETLIVVAMVGMLSAIAMPAIQKLREASRSVECQRRLGVFSQGTLQYQEVFDRMPPLTTGPGPVFDVGAAGGVLQNHQHSGTITYLLPFIGQQEIFDELPVEFTSPEFDLFSPKSNFSTFNELLNDPGLTFAFNQQIESWICPSNAEYLDAIVSFLTLWSPVQLSQSGGTGTAFIFNVVSTDFGRSSYIPSMGGFNGPFASATRAFDFDLEQASGPLRNRLDGIRSDELIDGSSNTVCFGESVGWIDSASASSTGKPQLVGANFALFGNAAITGNAFFVDGADEPASVFGSATGSVNFLFGSMHPDGVPIAMCDGSVRSVNRNTSRQVMAALGCGADSWILPRE